MKSIRISAAVAAPGHEPIGRDDLPAGDEQRVIDGYNALVAGLSRDNARNRAWWYGWLSSRDRHNNSLLADLMLLAQAERRLDRDDDNGEPTIHAASPAVAAAVARRARGRGWSPRRTIADRLSWGWRRALRAVANPIGAAKVLAHGARQMSAARRFPIESDGLSGNDVILITILHDPAGISGGRGEGAYRDTYFGDLPSRLARAGERVLVIGQPLSDPESVTAPLAGFTRPAVASVGHVLRWRDIAAASMGALRGRILIGGIARDPEIRDLIKFSTANNAIYVGLATIVERAIARLLAVNPKARILHIYENNPWERAVALAASDAPGERDVRGFLHCAVLPSHLKNYITPEERRIRPAPGRIICTGPAARELFLSLGAHDPARVDAGCDLRGPDFAALSRRDAPPAKIETVLVLLEGLETMVGLLRFADQMARRRADIRFLVREHPALGLDALLPLAGIALGSGEDSGGLRRSNAVGLVDAIETADAVIYQGTTAAMIAGAMGVPLIRLARDGVLSGDPLAGCDALKQSVATPEDCDAALTHATAMPLDRFLDEAEKLRRHITACLAPKGDRALAPFMASR